MLTSGVSKSVFCKTSTAVFHTENAKELSNCCEFKIVYQSGCKFDALTNTLVCAKHVMQRIVKIGPSVFGRPFVKWLALCLSPESVAKLLATDLTS